ncbi:GntR family transcriptional regulator [Burkholderia pyrrocinia]
MKKLIIARAANALSAAQSIVQVSDSRLKLDEPPNPTCDSAKKVIKASRADSNAAREAAPRGWRCVEKAAHKRQRQGGKIEVSPLQRTGGRYYLALQKRDRQSRIQGSRELVPAAADGNARRHSAQRIRDLTDGAVETAVDRFTPPCGRTKPIPIPRWTERAPRDTGVTMQSVALGTRSAPVHSCSTSSNPNDWRPDFERIQGHVANAIADQIEEAIRSGLFQPGDKLPTQQAIAGSLGFHLNTIYAAFGEVARCGLTRGFACRGKYVIGPTPYRRNSADWQHALIRLGSRFLCQCVATAG